ncbi:MAG TPA: bacteriohemerythrin [Nitrospirota bacterium]|nr:bacteriohemerythrin [Nitrospirota bacterium]
MKIQWTPDLATGSSEIDAQHVELFKRIDSLFSTFDQGVVKRSEIDRTVQFLSEYVAQHFGTEEAYMTKYAYSSRSAHLSQHQQFIKSFGKLKDRIHKEGIVPEVAQETKELCTDWLVTHIKFSDKALGMFLKMKMR